MFDWQLAWLGPDTGKLASVNDKCNLQTKEFLLKNKDKTNHNADVDSPSGSDDFKSCTTWETY